MLRTMSVVFVSLLIVSPVAAEDKEVDWGFYMQSPAAISAIGAAVSLATPCQKGLIFEETADDAARSIAMHCPGDSGYDFSVVVNFDVFGKQIVPRGFDLAG